MTTITDFGAPTQLVEGRPLGGLGPSSDVTSIASHVTVGSGQPTTVSCHDGPRSGTSRRHAGDPVDKRLSI
jgi:hypothetical protein